MGKVFVLDQGALNISYPVDGKSYTLLSLSFP